MSATRGRSDANGTAFVNRRVALALTASSLAALATPAMSGDTLLARLADEFRAAEAAYANAKAAELRIRQTMAETLAIEWRTPRAMPGFFSLRDATLRSVAEIESYFAEAEARREAATRRLHVAGDLDAALESGRREMQALRSQATDTLQKKHLALAAAGLPEAEAAASACHAAARTSFRNLLAYPCTDIADVRMKASLLLASPFLDEELTGQDLKTLLRSLVAAEG